MSDSNRLRLAIVRETTLGVTPGSPRMRTMRVTGESLRYTPKFVTSAEIRSDRMNSDPVKVNEENQGPVNFELNYPVDLSPLSEVFASAFFNSWTNTPNRDNDGNADSVITDINATGGVVTVVTGTAFVVGQLVRFSGFGQAANNGLFRCTTGSAIVPAFTSQGIVSEAAPAAAARMKVVGFEGASGDITATATGLGSTALDFTTLGLSVGQWIKIGASGVGNQFATPILNDWVRVTAIATNALTLDNLPSGWTTDSGTGKSIRVFFGDVLKNGTTRKSLTIERGFMDQTTPTYIIQRGMVAGQFDLKMDSEQIITGSATFTGLTGSQSTTPLSATPDATTTAASMSSNVSVGRIAENGSAISSPNWAKSLSLQINNNLRAPTALGTVGAVDIGAGECAVTGTVETYFGSNALLQKLLTGTVSNLNTRATKNNQALLVSLPRVTFTDGSPSAGAKNQDVMLPLQFTASMDSTTNCVVQMDRLEYFE
jgi:hypothetical protein